MIPSSEMEVSLSSSIQISPVIYFSCAFQLNFYPEILNLFTWFWDLGRGDLDGELFEIKLLLRLLEFSKLFYLFVY